VIFTLTALDPDKNNGNAPLSEKVGHPQVIDKYDIMVELGLGYNWGLRVLHSVVCRTDGCGSWSDVLIRGKGKMNLNT